MFNFKIHTRVLILSKHFSEIFTQRDVTQDFLCVSAEMAVTVSVKYVTSFPYVSCTLSGKKNVTVMYCLQCYHTAALAMYKGY
jgi:hypothetical protein